MDISPQAIASASFPVVKKGFDPDHVRSFLSEVGRALESAQNQSTAMEARARAAVAKLQELTQATAKAPEQATISSDDADAISRTLLLAQKAADATIAEARTEADTMVSAARAEAATLLADARRQAAIHIEEARSDARRTSEAEKQRVESEVQALLARREFLVSDVEHLDEFVTAQRNRIQDVAALLAEVADRGPGGLGDMRKPLLSAAADGLSLSSTSAGGAGRDIAVEAPAAEPVVDRWEAEPAVEVEIVADPVDAPVLDAVDTPAAAPGDASEDDVDLDLATTRIDAVAADPDIAVDPDITGDIDLDAAIGVFDDDVVTDSESTPAQSPALLDFDDLDPTTEVPIIRPHDR